MKKAIHFFFNNDNKKRIQDLLYDAQEQKKQIQDLREQYEVVQSQYLDYFAMLNQLTVDMDASVWSKDKNHRYILANPIHCRDFFGIDDTPECISYIKNKNDEELINEFYLNRGFTNTFSEICTLSDEYVKFKGKQCHFMEAGYINEDQVLLYVVKFPRYNELGEFDGTHGMAWDFTTRSSIVVNMLNRWMYDKKIETIFCKDDVFCHALNGNLEDQCDIFKHICPSPERIGCGSINENCQRVCRVD